MDGLTITLTASNIVAIIGMVYYIKGKLDRMEKQQDQDKQELKHYIDIRIDDLKEYVNVRFNDLYKMFNNRIKGIEHIVYRED